MRNSAIVFPVLLWTLLGAPLVGYADEEGAEADASLVATWGDGGSLSRADYESWLAFHGLEDTPEAIRELVVLQSLADIRRRQGAELDPRIRLEIEAMRQRRLIPALRRHVQAAVTVSDEEVEALLRAHPEAFQRPKKLRLRNLYKRLGEGSDAATVRRRMEEIHRRLEEGADFQELARRESESQTRFRDGALGYVDPQELPAAVAAAVRDLEPGQISRPVEHGDGVTIFLCEDIREAHNPTPDEVREKIRTQLLRQRTRQRWAAFQTDLLAAAAPRLTPDSPTTVLTLGDYRLSAEELAILVRLRFPGRELSDLDRSRRETLLRDWAVGVLSARRAVELRLDQDPQIAAALRWRPLEILSRHELRRRIEARFQEPTEEALRAHFDADPGRYQEPAGYDLGVIHFGEEEDPASGIEQAEAVVRRLETGELTFEEAARRHSAHPSAADGGRLGWQSRQQVTVWGPTVIHALRQLGPGAQSGLLHLESGWWIFRLYARRDARPLSFAEARDPIRNELGQQQVDALERAVREEHLRELGVQLPSETAPPRVLRWSTANEFENFGYHVYRGRSEDGPFERLTEEPIPGAGTTDLPQSYRFEDTTAEPGVTYYYYIESVSTSGQRKRLTPVRPAGAGES